MARRFGRNLENPERRIEREGDFSQIITKDAQENPYDDEFDKRLGDSEESSTDSKRKEFTNTIKVEQPKMDTPLSLAYRELDRARQSRDREEIIKAEDKILDLERQEEEKEYNVRIAELKEMQKAARESNDTDALKNFKRTRQKFFTEMKYDELNYKINKLQNSYRLEPSKEKMQQIVALKEELETLEMEQMSK